MGCEAKDGCPNLHEVFLADLSVAKEEELNLRSEA
jgi:hypothetical protein